MDSPNRAALLERYWKGDTSPADEVMLKELSKQHPELFAPEELKYFKHMDAIQNLSLPMDFADLNLDNVEELPQLKSKKSWASYYRAAAAIALLVASSLGAYQWNSSMSTSRFADAETEEAFQTTQKALALISSKMSKVKGLTGALQKFDSTTQKIKSSTQN